MLVVQGMQAFLFYLMLSYVYTYYMYVERCDICSECRWVLDCQLLIVLHVTSYSSCRNACAVHTAYCWVGTEAIDRDRDIYRDVPIYLVNGSWDCCMLKMLLSVEEVRRIV